MDTPAIPPPREVCQARPIDITGSPDTYVPIFSIVEGKSRWTEVRRDTGRPS